MFERILVPLDGSKVGEAALPVVEFHGKGIIRKLLIDRGFLDGPNIGRCKQEWGIDVLIPARRSMDIYQEVLRGCRPRGNNCTFMAKHCDLLGKV